MTISVLSEQERREAARRPTATLTAMHYRSVEERPEPVRPVEPGRLQIVVPTPSRFAIPLLAVGIGDEGGEIVAALERAAWFRHLRTTTRGAFRTGVDALVDAVGDASDAARPAVGSVALPLRPDAAAVAAAAAVGRAVRKRGGFAVATVSAPSDAALVRLGGAFDCVVEGDGSAAHHCYPIRTVTEPATARLICYDLYDVCLLWAGRIGRFGTLDPGADALHVEVSAAVETLLEVDRLAYATAAELHDPERLAFFNVVEGARPGATAVSFSDSLLVQQERAAGRRDGQAEEAPGQARQ